MGDQVQYWSHSKARWVDARVELRQKRKGGEIVYDLNCKKGTSASRLRPKPSEYRVGEKVEYWSEAAGQWVVAKVVRVSLQLGQCDLDIKSGAKLGRVRRLSASEELPDFKLGDRVQYWSESKGRWLEAVVEGSHKRRGTKLYDLNCKKCTPVSRLRLSPGSQPTPFQPGEPVEYWSTSAKRWLPAKVLRLAAHLGQCDLDVKQAAAIGRLRRPVPAGAGSQKAPKAAAASHSDRGSRVTLKRERQTPKAASLPPAKQSRAASPGRSRAEERRVGIP